MEKKNLKLSIIIPNFNSGSTLEQTLNSILGQNYPNLELIVIDGKSTDNSPDIIKKYKQHLSYWVSEIDRGQAHAINKGLKIATGDYIAFMNADDLYLPGAFNQFEHLVKNKPYDFIFGNVKVGINPFKSYLIKNRLTTLDLGKLLLFFFNVRFIIPSQSVWIKRDFLIQNQLDILDENLNYCMDLEWYCRISLCKPNTFKIVKPYSFFRLTGNTKTILNAREMKEESLLVAQKYLVNLKHTKLKNWYRYKLLDRILRKIYAKKLKCNIAVLTWILKKTGLICIFDKRILGLFKLAIKNEIRIITST